MHRLTATDTPMVRYTRTIFPSYAQRQKFYLLKNDCSNNFLESLLYVISPFDLVLKYFDSFPCVPLKKIRSITTPFNTYLVSFSVGCRQ